MLNAIEMWRITAKLTHNTTNEVCVSVSISVQLPDFYVQANSESDALQKAKLILSPFDLQYESVSAEIKVTKA